jgi:hypothetical protein
MEDRGHQVRFEIWRLGQQLLAMRRPEVDVTLFNIEQALGCLEEGFGVFVGVQIVETPFVDIVSVIVNFIFLELIHVVM